MLCALSNSKQLTVHIDEGFGEEWSGKVGRCAHVSACIISIYVTDDEVVVGESGVNSYVSFLREKNIRFVERNRSLTGRNHVVSF